MSAGKGVNGALGPCVRKCWGGGGGGGGGVCRAEGRGVRLVSGGSCVTR